MYTFAAQKLFPTEACTQVLAENHTEPNTYDRDIDNDEDETLSFCDFSLENDSVAVEYWDDSSRDSENISSIKSSKQDDYFEFCTTQLWSSPHEPPKSIGFFGKSISFKQPLVSEKPQQFPGKSKQRKQEIFRKKGSDDSREEASKYTNSRQRRSDDRSFLVQKLSAFSTSRKSNWYLFIFGSTRIRTQMELKDMKKRQSRRRGELLRMDDDDDASKSMGRSGGVYFPGLLRALSCGGHH